MLLKLDENQYKNQIYIYVGNDRDHSLHINIPARFSDQFPSLFYKQETHYNSYPIEAQGNGQRSSMSQGRHSTAVRAGIRKTDT